MNVGHASAHRPYLFIRPLLDGSSYPPFPLLSSSAALRGLALVVGAAPWGGAGRQFAGCRLGVFPLLPSGGWETQHGESGCEAPL